MDGEKVLIVVITSTTLCKVISNWVATGLHLSNAEYLAKGKVIKETLKMLLIILIKYAQECFHHAT